MSRGYASGSMPLEGNCTPRVRTGIVNTPGPDYNGRSADETAFVLAVESVRSEPETGGVGMLVGLYARVASVIR